MCRDGLHADSCFAREKSHIPENIGESVLEFRPLFKRQTESAGSKCFGEQTANLARFFLKSRDRKFYPVAIIAQSEWHFGRECLKFFKGIHRVSIALSETV